MAKLPKFGKLDLSKIGKKIQLDKVKKMSGNFVDKVKESGVIDKMKEGIQEGINIVSSKMTSGLSGEVKEKFTTLQNVINEIVKKKQESGKFDESLAEKAKSSLDEVIAACRKIEKIVKPEETKKPEEKPVELPKPEEPPKSKQTQQ